MRGEWQKHIALRCAPARTADAVIFIGSDEQMFGAKQQIPHGLRSDQEA